MLQGTNPSVHVLHILWLHADHTPATTLNTNLIVRTNPAPTPGPPYRGGVVKVVHVDTKQSKAVLLTS